MVVLFFFLYFSFVYSCVVSSEGHASLDGSVGRLEKGEATGSERQFGVKKRLMEVKSEIKSERGVSEGCGSYRGGSRSCAEV